MPRKGEKKERPLLKCNDCDYSTRERALITQHVGVVKHDFKCSKCDFTSTRKQVSK